MTRLHLFSRVFSLLATSACVCILAGCGGASTATNTTDPQPKIAENAVSPAIPAEAKPTVPPSTDIVPSEKPSDVPVSPAPPEPTKVAASDPPKPNDIGDTATKVSPADLDLSGPVFPYEFREPAPEFSEDREWLNTERPLKLADLRGKFVLLDFWTYCCINCMHILPELKKLEHAYPNNLVVIGVHSAKFDTEQDTANIRDAILRYEIEHPVLNDHDHAVWDKFGINSWPTMLLLDPEGNVVTGFQGEQTFAQLSAALERGLPYYREKKLLNERPLDLKLEAHAQAATPLRFPGKILADEAGQRLFISDSNHNRIVVTDLQGKLLYVIGSGAIGKQDGPFGECSFDHPQGTVLHGDTLYVADTENHLLRKVDLKAGRVSTIAGLGEQGRIAWPGLDKLGRITSLEQLPERWVGKPLETGISSPWALWIHETDLYIAMAGPHQIWKMPLDESEIGPYAGNGREDIVDGPLLPRTPYQPGFSSFAQPSGLSSNGEWLFVADSEGSSIRAVPFAADQKVYTVVGTADLPRGRLFEFGDVDGPPGKARLQHPLDVLYHNGLIYVADTYNSKIKTIDFKSGETRTLAVTPEPGAPSTATPFDEPAGLAFAAGKLYVADTNHHVIRVVDMAQGNKVSTLAIEGLAPPPPRSPTPPVLKKPDFSRADRVTVAPVMLKPQGGKVQLQVALKLPPGWKINPLGPMGYYIVRTGNGSAISAESLERFVKVQPPAATVTIPLAVSGADSDTLEVGLVYYHCEEKEGGVCKAGSVLFTLPLKIDEAGQAAAELTYNIPD